MQVYRRRCVYADPVQEALSEFLANFVSYETLSTKLVPTAERMLLRSPEIALDSKLFLH